MIGCLTMDDQDWKPIKTAPHDKRILIWSGQEIYCANWVQNPITGDEAWIVADLGVDGDRAIVKATHWRVLPVPPLNERRKK